MTNPSPEIYPSVLTLHRLEVMMRLGVGSEERSQPQKVVIKVRLYLPGLPAAAQSDTAEYLCYFTLAEKINRLATSKEFRLIEYLTHEIYRLIRPDVPAAIKIWIKLRKDQILPYLQKGASYTYTDLAASAWTAPE